MFSLFRVHFTHCLLVMPTPNLLWAEWISFSASVSLLGLLTLCCSQIVPEALQLVFRYGKTVEKTKRVYKRVEIPKKWFFHFYVFAILFYSLLINAVINVYLYGNHVPTLIQLLLDTFVGSNRRATVEASSVAIAMVLMFVQVLRRLLECTQLSIYSQTGKMALIHYLCGFFFYFSVGLSLLAEANGFTQTKTQLFIHWSDILTTNHVIGVVIFAFSSFVQFKSHVILAKLRKDSLGRVVTFEHSIPRGSWFELVSCPHYLAEIFIYLSLLIVFMGKSTTWWMVCSFVVANQIIVGLFNHNWYLEHFNDYPKHRKAILPFII